MAAKLGLVTPDAPKQEAAAAEDATPAPEGEKDGEKQDAKPQEPKKDKHAINERFSKLAEQRRLAEEKERAADARAAKAEAEAAELRAKLNPPAPEPDEIGPEPQPSQFNSPTEYAKALSDWSVQKAFAERDAKEAARREAEAQTARAATWDARCKDFDKQAPDWRDKVNDVADQVLLSDQVKDAIHDSENGPALLLHFAEHPEDAEALRPLSVGAALRKLGMLEGKIEAKKESGTVTAGAGDKPQGRVEISRAPAPVTPIRGNGAAPEAPVGSDGVFHGTYADWKAGRKAGKIK